MSGVDGLMYVQNQQQLTAPVRPAQDDVEIETRTDQSDAFAVS